MFYLKTKIKVIVNVVNVLTDQISYVKWAIQKWQATGDQQGYQKYAIYADTTEVRHQAIDRLDQSPEPSNR